MTVAPIPVFGLLLLVRLRVFVGFPVVLRQELPPGAIFVVIPVVIVLVIAVIDAVVVVVTAMLFLASVISVSRRSGHRRWYGKGCGEKQSTEKKSIAAMHVYCLQAQEFHLGIPGTHAVCRRYSEEDVRKCTLNKLEEVGPPGSRFQTRQCSVSNWTDFPDPCLYAVPL